MQPLRPERNGSERRLRLAGKVYVDISMTASLALLSGAGLHIKDPVLFLVVLLLFLRYMLEGV